MEIRYSTTLKSIFFKVKKYFKRDTFSPSTKTVKEEAHVSWTQLDTEVWEGYLQL